MLCNKEIRYSNVCKGAEEIFDLVYWYSVCEIDFFNMYKMTGSQLLMESGCPEQKKKTLVFSNTDINCFY